MIVFRKLVIIAIAAAIFAGCSAPVRMYPPAPQAEVKQEPEARYTYDHKLDPEPGYQPKNIDALARQLSPIAPRRTVVVVVPRATARDAGRLRRSTGGRRARRSLRGDHYLNTLFWGGIGAAIGSTQGEAGQGAAIGAAFGHMSDHGGLHGLVSPGTLFGGAAGAALSGNRTKGAIWGAVGGHLLDDVFGGIGE